MSAYLPDEARIFAGEFDSPAALRVAVVFVAASEPPAPSSELQAA